MLAETKAVFLLLLFIYFFFFKEYLVWTKAFLIHFTEMYIILQNFHWGTFTLVLNQSMRLYRTSEVKSISVQKKNTTYVIQVWKMKAQISALINKEFEFLHLGKRRVGWYWIASLTLVWSCPASNKYLLGRIYCMALTIWHSHDLIWGDLVLSRRAAMKD